MYAAMMKSQTSTGEMRTVAVVPTTEDVRIFSRLGEGRGRAGAWIEGDVLIEQDELLVGQPVSLKTTPSEDRVINSTITPSMFLVKLGKKLPDTTKPSSRLALEEFQNLLNQALNDPSSLSIYEQAIVHVTQATPQPVVQEQQVAIPLPVQSEMSKETPMEIVTPMHTSTDAVLVIPEAKSYFSRVMDGKVTDVQVADYARKNQKTLLITGPAGTGKTSFTHHYAAINHLP